MCLEYLVALESSVLVSSSMSTEFAILLTSNPL